MTSKASYIIPFLAFVLITLGCAKDDITHGNILAYSVLVEVSGFNADLAEKATLINNGKEILEISDDGEHFFEEQIKTGDTYDVVIYEKPKSANCNLENAQGIVGDDSPRINLICSSKAWHHPVDLTENISPMGYDTLHPDVAMDDNGNVIIVWEQKDGSGKRHIYKSEYRDGVWIHPAGNFDFISPYDGDAVQPKVAMSNSGEAVIVWLQMNHNGSDMELCMSEYRNSVWTHPFGYSDSIGPSYGNLFGGSYPYGLAMDDLGNTIIAYSHTADNDLFEIFISMYKEGEWNHPEDSSDYISLTEGNATYPDLAMTNSGDAVLVWAEDSNTSLMVSEYVSGSWQHPTSTNERINQLAGTTQNPRVAMNDNGDLLISWWQESHIHKSERFNGEWTYPEDINDYISHPDSFAMLPLPSVANNGDAQIVWMQTTPYTYALYKSERRNEDWTYPENQTDFFTPGFTGMPNYFSSTMDHRGSSVVVWTQSDNSIYDVNRVYMSEYRNNEWDHPQHLMEHISPDDTSADPSSHLKTAMSNNGNSIIVWSQDNGSNNQIYMSEFK